MKNITKNILLIAFLFLCLYSCKNETKKSKENEIDIIVQHEMVQFPFVSLDSVWFDGNDFHINIVDSTAYLNNAYIEQYGTIHILQSAPHNYEFNEIILTVEMPNRKGEPIIHVFNQYQYDLMFGFIEDVDFKAFILEFITLNYEVRGKYYENMSTLIDRVNMICASEIDKHFPEYFPDNSTWFGYNSFKIFYQYFAECLNNEEGMYHKIIAGIEEDENFLENEDKAALLVLLEKYKTIFAER